MRRLFTLAFTLALGAGVSSPAAAVDDCNAVAMSVTAAISNDPGFVGLYKYTVTGSWDVGQQALSHIDFFLALQNCECVCDSRIVKFGSPAGTSTGLDPNEDPCTVNYVGQYLCMGDPTVPAELRAPTVKFEGAPGQTCEPATQGSGTWCFYSPLPPAPATVYVDAVAIKHGQIVCTGDLSGQLPQCDCSTPARPTTWGAVKAGYR